MKHLVKLESFTVKEFLNGAFDKHWNIGDLEAYKVDVERYLKSKEWFKDDLFTVANGLLVDPADDIVNPFAAPLDLFPEVNNPCREACVGDTNPSFKHHAEDQRCAMVDFPYTIASEDYIGSLTKKRRDNFKNSLQKEVAVTVEEVSYDNKYWMKVFSKRSKHYDFPYQHYPTMFKLMDRPPRTFVAYYQRQPIAAIGILYREIGESLVGCIEVFSSLEPCVRYVHQQLVEKFSQPGQILHYGGAASLDPTTALAYRYKFSLANASLRTPYFVVQLEDEYPPPYYDLKKKKWILRNA